jgi:serine/threonine-protein phosphatase 2A activator
MYNAEVLGKFPVVQHFPFGSLFAWEKDPSAKIIQASVHTSSQPKSNTIPSSTSSTSAYSSPRPQPHLRNPGVETQASRAPPQAQQQLRDPLAEPMSAATAAPWARSASTARPVAGPNVPSGPDQPTRVPWAGRTPAPPPPPPGGGTVAPWANKRS